ncbi:DEAD/DEAH box helicase [Hydrogenobacter sp. T-2]|uniref:DEAD/DEAH box helicase n=1 Tax=Pampinifervens diazotrophicum TaxID=1632018 RepID=UPI002B262204|nr:DEAD/DEAH box helicase [Hydrogenobacter sp. T-2]WPM32106.1 DEAD/DEAH box helicase [Hydrogenobacter sp. T-2]
MAETLTVYLLKESLYSVNPPSGKLLYFTNQDNEVKSEELLRAVEVDPKIPYSFLNPIQTLFYKLYKGGNALVSSPTSSGKSLIAYLFMKNFEGKVVYTAPTKALVKEKAVEFRTYYGKSVEMRTGDSVLESYKEVRAKVVVSTYENLAYAFRNSSRWLQEVEAVVIDEVHQISKRWMLEEIITACKKMDLAMLCLSATLPGLEELSEWIGANLVIKSAWRPVPLHREVMNLTKFKPIRKELEGEDLIAERLLSALFSLKQRGEQVILFVPKKSLGWKTIELAKEEKIGIMNQTLPFEVEEEREPEIAFHNADIPKEEREEIEKAFREGKLQTLIATQTLAYGVNLPADRVIIFAKFFRKKGKLKSIPDSLDILQMEGRAGRLGIREEGYSNLLVYGARDKDLQRELECALEKPFTTAVMEDAEDTALSFFLLLAHMYEGKNYENYLRNTYSFKKVSKERMERIERFLRTHGYLESYNPSQKGLFCIRTGIPPLSFEEFLRRRSLDLDPITTVRPLLYMKKFNGLYSFLKSAEGFLEELKVIRGMLLPCGEECLKDNTDQLLFYVKGLTVKYPNIKNPPGEFSYLGTDALHLLRNLMEINRHKFYRFSSIEMLQIAHALKYGIKPEYSSIAGIKGIGHIRVNMIKEVLKELNLEPPQIGVPVENFLEMVKREDFWELLLEKLAKYRKLNPNRAKEELQRIRKTFQNNRRGYMVDDKIILAYNLFLEGAVALKKTKRELIEVIR